MGVKTTLSLKSLDHLFPTYNFTKLTPTRDGLIDTTYMAHTTEQDYILKRFEQAHKQQIKQSNTFVDYLHLHALNVSRCIDEKDGWYIYEKLDGKIPTLTNTKQIQALARFLAKMHTLSYKKSTTNDFYTNYPLAKILQSIKTKHFLYYKKLTHLKNFTPHNDGIIHGDIFRDNTLFDGDKLGVFDFIEFGNGSFAFDVGVALTGFGIKEKHHYFIKLFLNTYNQHAPKKLTKQEILKHLNIASKFYALLRIEHHNSTSKAKELL